MLSFFRPKPLIDENSADWIFAAFAWALTHFDRQEFHERTRLIQPSNEFFPGRVSSVDDKAANIFRHTVRYAGLQHWPFELGTMLQMQTDSRCQIPPQPQPELSQLRRNSQAGETGDVPVLVTQQPLFIFYNPQQTLKPEDLSASYSHVIGQHLILQRGVLPPGGQDYFAEGAEILAHMMGFGVLLVNSSYTFRGGCGSCYNAMANRQAALGELENLFALALFSRLKGIPDKEALANVKKHLHRSYRQAGKQINRYLENNRSEHAQVFLEAATQP